MSACTPCYCIVSAFLNTTWSHSHLQKLSLYSFEKMLFLFYKRKFPPKLFIYLIFFNFSPGSYNVEIVMSPTHACSVVCGYNISCSSSQTIQSVIVLRSAMKGGSPWDCNLPCLCLVCVTVGDLSADAEITTTPNFLFNLHSGSCHMPPECHHVNTTILLRTAPLSSFDFAFQGGYCPCVKLWEGFKI